MIDKLIDLAKDLIAQGYKAQVTALLVDFNVPYVRALLPYQYEKFLAGLLQIKANGRF